MTIAAGVGALGRPGVFFAPAPAPAQLRPEELDVAGFVGVALRGPVDTPVQVGRWSDYEQIFGGFERPDGGPERLLPYAVSAYFRQGGQQAYVLRVAPHGPNADDPLAATAQYQLRLPGLGDDAPVLAAADEGTWGDALTIRLRYDVRQRVTATVTASRELRLPTGTRVSAGSLLRLRDPTSNDLGDPLRWVVAVDDRLPRGSQVRVVVDRDIPAGTDAAIGIDVVTGALDIIDGSAPGRAGEQLTDLALRPGHPRYLTELLKDGRHLVRPLGAWQLDLTPSVELLPVEADRVTDGADRSALIDGDSFFDLGAADQDPLGEEDHVGVDRMGRVPAIGLLCVPDLTWGTTSPDELDLITDRQARLVDVARVRHRFVALLDVPDGLSVAQISAWRARFDNSYAAAYHPWLAVAGSLGAPAIAVPPSAFAAGIIADRELRLGLPWGPANELAQGAVRSEAVITDELHDRLHALDINVFRAERDGFRLSAGRTLSSDPEYRQLSVRRVMTMIRLSLERQTQWLAFEPNNDELRERLARVVTGFLRDLNRRGAFAGATEAESFFVRCGNDLNPQSSLALGRLITEVGVAPASPLEYILVRIARDVDGSLSVVADEG